MLLKNCVAKRIKELLKKQNLTQYELFKLSGVAQSTISTILNSKTKTINLQTLYQICAGLNVEISEFFDCEYLKLNNIAD